jgi:hypothetical protein
VEINDEKYLVVGVMPAGFRFPESNNEIWAPAGSSYSPSDFSNKGWHNAMVAARLKPGIRGGAHRGGAGTSWAYDMGQES